LRFNSVEQVLNQLETQPAWEKFRQHRQLLKCWDLTVNQQTAKHTRPLYINRQILFIATDSAARAQELSFQRYALLKRLNQQLTFKLKDLRFSSSQWHQPIYSLENQPPLFVLADDKSRRKRSPGKISLDFAAAQKSPERGETELNKQNHTSPQMKAKNAAKDWLKRIEQKAASTTIFCPKCQAATSKEELARWNLCHHCIADRWQSEYRPPAFPKPK